MSNNLSLAIFLSGFVIAVLIMIIMKITIKVIKDNEYRIVFAVNLFGMIVGFIVARFI